MRGLIQKTLLVSPAPVRTALVPLARAYNAARLRQSVGNAVDLITSRRSAEDHTIFVDCGFSDGAALEEFIKTLPGKVHYYGFEMQDEFIPHAQKLRAAYVDPAKRPIDRRVNLALNFFAVSDHDDVIDYYRAGRAADGLYHPVATTLGQARKVATPISYRDSIKVRAFNFSRWLKDISNKYHKLYGRKPYVVVKMDIGGAEFAVLEKTLKDGNITFVDAMFVDFHAHQFAGRERLRFKERRSDIILAARDRDIPFRRWGL